MVWPVKTRPAQSTGPEGKKTSGVGENCSPDFSFYRTSTITAVLLHAMRAEGFTKPLTTSQCNPQNGSSGIAGPFSRPRLTD